MLAEVFIDELKTMAIIGCNPEERVTKQPLIISLAYQYDIDKAAESDNVDFAIDYDSLCKRLTTYIEASQFQLIETLAEKLIEFIFSNSSIEKVSLSVYKPDAINNAKRVGIKLQREKKSIQKTSVSSSLNWE